MMDWTTHPGMNNLDPLKREIIRTAAKQVQGKSGNQDGYCYDGTDHQCKKT